MPPRTTPTTTTPPRSPSARRPHRSVLGPRRLHLRHPFRTVIPADFPHWPNSPNRTLRHPGSAGILPAIKYHEWNPIQETITDAATSTVATKAYVWGNDLSGNLHGAGGVGGLLSMKYNSESFFYAYDGNGNVRALVKADAVNPASSSITARYAYDGFGKEVAVSGADADKNAFRFSTKQLDAETGMNYYGYRFYAADAGRWINRDPIAEQGGMNIYAQCGNGLISAFDMLGMWKATSESYGKARRVYTYEKNDTWQGLADKVKLSKDDISMWANIESGNMDLSKDPACGTVSVPNVWIASDVLRGGGLYDRFVNLGGTIGIFFGTDLATYGYKVVKPNDIPDLLSALDGNTGNIWGMAVFGHGGPYLAMPGATNAQEDQSGGWTKASTLHAKVTAGGYKLSKIYLMQCYSGANGWGATWQKAGIDVTTYQGINALGFDLYHITP